MTSRSLQQYAPALPVAGLGMHCRNALATIAASDSKRLVVRGSHDRQAQTLRGANMMTAMPSRQQAAPSRSHRVGVMRSTHHNHSKALAI